ncbi:hypothetical protein GCM10011380_08740 [Sphingomonas metalli]|uniref:HNH domain-containing protein n=1 Tax=Sphingomonas metalli TaxID=1779358 RepID=A0A916WP91_9SPHN|nr:hypothetical protein GCM10011380_08740 [Sphingomonas metalli]
MVCEECRRQGRTTLGRIADHVKPLAEGGTGERSNYQLLCQACSDAKGLKDKGQQARAIGVDRTGRPTSASHPWSQSAPVSPMSRRRVTPPGGGESREAAGGRTEHGGSCAARAFPK